MDRVTALGIRLTHYDLSCMLACTRESVSKEMSRFQQAGLIQTRDRTIYVLDPQGLAGSTPAG